LGENRYRVLKKNNPDAAAILMKRANEWTVRRFALYEKLAAMSYGQDMETEYRGCLQLTL
jgi:pyruvate-ferredoxin/flavodoxin oxidoreductase